MNIINKRFQKEIRQLYIQQSQRNLLENDYLIDYDETNTHKLHAIIKGPHDSVYRHKFIRLDFIIPDNYPHSPPEVSFINHDNVRIHPNMYENGKCCATILNTWGDNQFEKWTSSMGIETILLTFHSFLDNNPYTYEPGDRDDPSYTVYVEHQSWTSCLIRYLQNEDIEPFKEFIHNYLLLNIDNIFQDLQTLDDLYKSGYYHTRCFEIDEFYINYSKISSKLQDYYNYIEFCETEVELNSFEEFTNRDYKCCICYDTTNTDTDMNTLDITTLQCSHSFHKACLQDHMQTNNSICPMCRTELSEYDKKNNENINEQGNEQGIWMINPLTKRKIKIGGRTFNYLKNNGDI